MKPNCWPDCENSPAPEGKLNSDEEPAEIALGCDEENRLVPNRDELLIGTEKRDVFVGNTELDPKRDEDETGANKDAEEDANNDVEAPGAPKADAKMLDDEAGGCPKVELGAGVANNEGAD